MTKPYPIPDNEEERLAALRAYFVLDTLPEVSFDRIAAAAARAFQVPIALVSLVDSDRQWFKAKVGIDATETSRDVSFCAHAMLDDAPMVVCDAMADARFKENSLVTSEPLIRFYAGAPLRTREGLPIGALCVIDTEARERPAPEALAMLSDLAYLVEEQLEFRAAVEAKLRVEEEYRLFAETAQDVFLIFDEGGRIAVANGAAKRLLGYLPEELAGKPVKAILPDNPKPAGVLEVTARHRSGNQVPVEVSFSDFESGGRKFTAVLRDITERKRDEAELRQLVREKETLIQEVHHRVKNNLQVILSLLQLQCNTLEDERVVAILQESRQRILTMAMIHETLCGSDKISEIDFADYAETLVGGLFCAYSNPGDGVSYRVMSDRLMLSIDQAIPCGLILNELVTNALKYAYKDRAGGEVRVEVRQDGEGTVRLSVGDDGAGLPEGYDWRNGSSLGLRIVDVLVKQLKGRLNVASRAGATFSFEFPKEA